MVLDYFMVQRRRSPVFRNFSALLERPSQGQEEESLSGGTLLVDNEDLGAGRVQGEGDGPGGDEVGSVEPIAPASSSGLVAYSPLLV